MTFFLIVVVYGLAVTLSGFLIVHRIKNRRQREIEIEEKKKMEDYEKENAELRYKIDSLEKQRSGRVYTMPIFPEILDSINVTENNIDYEQILNEIKRATDPSAVKSARRTN